MDKYKLGDHDSTHGLAPSVSSMVEKTSNAALVR